MLNVLQLDFAALIILIKDLQQQQNVRKQFSVCDSLQSDFLSDKTFVMEKKILVGKDLIGLRHATPQPPN